MFKILKWSLADVVQSYSFQISLQKKMIVNPFNSEDFP